MDAGERHLEGNVGDAADLYVQSLAELRRHALAGDACGVVAGREKFECELALAVGGLLVAESGGGVDEDDVGSGNAADGGIEDGAVDGAGGAILREAGDGEG